MSGHPDDRRDDGDDPRWVEPEIIGAGDAAGDGWSTVGDDWSTSGDGSTGGDGPTGHGPPRRARARSKWAMVLLAAAVLIVVVTAVVRRVDQPPSGASTAGSSSAASSIGTARASSAAASSAAPQPVASGPVGSSLAASTALAGSTAGSAIAGSAIAGSAIAGSTATSPPSATDLLVTGAGYSSNVGGGHMTLNEWELNISDLLLTLTGPIRLVGPKGRPLPHSSVVIVDGWVGESGPPSRTSSSPLRSIAPHQKVTIVVSLDLDCGSDAVERHWPERYPMLVAPLSHFTEPWTQPLNDVVGQGQPARTFYQQVCAESGP